MLCNHAGMWQQEHLAMTKHEHRASNLANEDVNLVGKHGAISMVVQHSYLSNLRVKASILLVKH